LRRRYVLLILLAPLAVLGFWTYIRNNEPPTALFVKARRETLISSLITNGKVEPLHYASVRTDLAGMVAVLPVKEGQTVAASAELAQLKVPELDAQLAAAQSRVEQAKGALDNIERGGRKAELVEIDSNIARARLESDAALREYNTLHRLEEKQAATHEEVQIARNKLDQIDLGIKALESKRAALITSSDQLVAEARFHEAEADLRLAQRRIADTIVRSPMAGIVYNLPIRMGMYLNVGEPVASVGVLDRLRARVYVDEPELGRVSVGLPVNITWDALPGQRWPAVVEQLPVEVYPLGTRHVGEVLCTIDNPGRLLVPGTNINAEIRSQVVHNALTIPKEALRRDAKGAGVFVLTGGTIHWRAIKVGASSINRVQIADGLAEGDDVALPTDLALRDGEKVKAEYP
jgi:RND family efflux transporter MFP subunit